MADPTTPVAGSYHSRDMSLPVAYKPKEVSVLAKEILDGTIAEVHLSLFTYWVCKKHENYQQAKKYIRELGLDQAYPTIRIENQRLRKIVEDTIELRPRYKYEDSESEDEDSLSDDGSSGGCQYPRKRAPLRVTLESMFRLPSSDAPMGSSSHARADKISPCKLPKTGEILRSRQVSSPLRPRSPWPARAGSLPAIMNKGTRVLAANETKSSATSVTQGFPSPDFEYPPDTPDRPAPLNIRTSGSESAPSTALSRSVSTPMRVKHTPSFAYSPSVWRIGRDLFPLPLLHESQSSARNDQDGTGAKSVISLEQNNRRRSNLFTAALKRFGSLAVNRSPESVYRPVRYELEPHELAKSECNSPPTQRDYSNSIWATPNNKTSKQPADESVFEDIQHVLSTARSEQAAAGSQFSFTSDNRHFNMQRAAHEDTRITQLQSNHNIMNSPSRHSKLISSAAPTPAQRRAATKARRAARTPDLNPSSGFHRPLPLRSYESEAFLYPTARAQGQSTHHNRASSLDPSPTRTRNTSQLGGMGETTNCMDSSILRLSTSPNTTVAPSDRSSNASLQSLDVSAFPDVPSWTSSPSPHTIGVAYRSITEAYMKQRLQQTRARGTQLAVVEWSSLSTVDVAWRDRNEQLLVAVYGKKDVELTATDVDYVDRIGREMREGVGQTGGYEWVSELFASFP